MWAFLEDLFRSCECTDQTSCVVSDILWRFLHRALGLNKRPSKAAPARAERPGRAAQPRAPRCLRRAAGPGLGGSGHQQQPSDLCAGLSSHTNLGLVLFTDSSPACHSLCYTATRETFFLHHTRNSGLIPKWNSLSAGFSFQSLCTLCCTYDDSNKLK